MNKLKYYVYISQSKVDMLHSQIPSSIRSKLEAEVKLNLQLAEISFSKKQFSDNLYTKLNLVIDYLTKQNLIGNINEPLEYFRGILYMGWAQIYPSVIFFGGTSNETTVGLGGSMNNLLGYTWDISSVAQGISHTPWLISVLNKEVEFLVPFDSANTKYGKTEYGTVENTPKDEYEKRVLSATSHWANDILSYSDRALQEDMLNNRPYISSSEPRYQINKFEFVAKVLRYSNYDPSKLTAKVLLGTPIYVSRIE
jgi:hypothetical protein